MSIASIAKAGVARFFDGDATPHIDQKPSPVTLPPEPLQAFIAKVTRTNERLTDPKNVQAQLDVIEFVDQHTEFIEAQLPLAAKAAERAAAVARDILTVDGPNLTKASGELRNAFQYLGIGCRIRHEPTEDSPHRSRLQYTKDWGAVPEDPDVVQTAIIAMEAERAEWYKRISAFVS